MIFSYRAQVRGAQRLCMGDVAVFGQKQNNPKERIYTH